MTGVEEDWRDIPEWEGLYQASTLGRIRSRDRICRKLTKGGTLADFSLKGRILSPGYGKRTGYWLVILAGNGRKVTMPVHVAVCAAFHGPRPHKLDVAHLDGDRSNNEPSNLGYFTRSENLGHQIAHGTHLHGEKRWNARLTDDQVNDIVGMRRRGERNADIASIYPVTSEMVSHIMAGRRWSRVTGIQVTGG